MGTGTAARGSFAYGPLASNPLAAPASSDIGQPPSSGPRQTLADNLKDVSLAAVAEPYLGTTSGLSFAKLTQAVLRRLSPDGTDFVFTPSIDGIAVPLEGTSPLHLDFLSNEGFDYDHIFDFSLLTGEGAIAEYDAQPLSNDMLCLTSLPERTEVLRLVMFYFDHSHTLYPIVHQQEFMADLHALLLEPNHPLAQSPPCMFRVWMILAIGSTAHSSITLAEESASRIYYEKAMTYFEASIDNGDLVRDVQCLAYIDTFLRGATIPAHGHRAICMRRSLAGDELRYGRILRWQSRRNVVGYRERLHIRMCPTRTFTP